MWFRLTKNSAEKAAKEQLKAEAKAAKAQAKVQARLQQDFATAQASAFHETNKAQSKAFKQALKSHAKNRKEAVKAQAKAEKHAKKAQAQAEKAALRSLKGQSQPSLAAALDMKTPEQYAARLKLPAPNTRITGISVNAKTGGSVAPGSFNINLDGLPTAHQRVVIQRPVQVETVVVDQPIVDTHAKMEKAKIIQLPPAEPKVLVQPVIQPVVQPVEQQVAQPVVALAKPVAAVPVAAAPVALHAQQQSKQIAVSAAPHRKLAKQPVSVQAAPAAAVNAIPVVQAAPVVPAAPVVTLEQGSIEQPQMKQGQALAPKVLETPGAIPCPPSDDEREPSKTALQVRARANPIKMDPITPSGAPARGHFQSPMESNLRMAARESLQSPNLASSVKPSPRSMASPSPSSMASPSPSSAASSSRAASPMPVYQVITPGQSKTPLRNLASPSSASATSVSATSVSATSVSPTSASPSSVSASPSSVSASPSSVSASPSSVSASPGVPSARKPDVAQLARPSAHLTAPSRRGARQSGARANNMNFPSPSSLASSKTEDNLPFSPGAIYKMAGASYASPTASPSYLGNPAASPRSPSPSSVSACPASPSSVASGFTSPGIASGSNLARPAASPGTSAAYKIAGPSYASPRDLATPGNMASPNLASPNLASPNLASPSPSAASPSSVASSWNPSPASPSKPSPRSLARPAKVPPTPVTITPFSPSDNIYVGPGKRTPQAQESKNAPVVQAKPDEELGAQDLAPSPSEAPSPGEAPTPSEAPTPTDAPTPGKADDQKSDIPEGFAASREETEKYNIIDVEDVPQATAPRRSQEPDMATVLQGYKAAYRDLQKRREQLRLTEERLALAESTAAIEQERLEAFEQYVKDVEKNAAPVQKFLSIFGCASKPNAK
ncbi:hypothetical protein GNI_114030 [Gregarina niphandrodes]|uniref:Uncharacterized protein n=1 Tax=Gregarina niphandrodes TaxID=110365 RepID=A0A023B3H8_GRENI|nr:hypothetical protein GNI_114030 [Gregarina niphandrodes]EZG55360.1 hypothetical protein GNI_114030 [Gregarina niphandrodes]|eukprot:XP_011131607.1 hypothetical protein GNI_114030 [Gregarina niphandrodes]